MNLPDCPVLPASTSGLGGAFGVPEHAPCKVDGCDRIDPKMTRGMCGMHYRRWKRGTLDKPRYTHARGAVGMRTQFPFEFRKVDGTWHRRPSGSKEPWEVGSLIAPFLDPNVERDAVKGRGLL